MISKELKRHGNVGSSSPSWLIAILLIGVFVDAGRVQSRNTLAAFQSVTKEQLLSAMRRETSYNTQATTNVARFQAHVILRLARQAQATHPHGPPLLIRHMTWYHAFLQAYRLREEQAPLFLRLAVAHQQDQIIDYRYNNVIKKMKQGPVPEIALNVKVCWPEKTDLPAHYSFDDTLATPRLQVTNHRVITYRLLDFGDRIVYDEIAGLTGRPTTGLLGALFKVIGEGRVVRSSMAFSDDGLQVARTHSKKGPFSINATVTVQPDGEMTKGIPGNRTDLRKLEKKVKQRFTVQYVPFSGPLKTAM